uniref:Uncharacterized protein n=1 Tax=Schistosoma curassoni TaxID=6186 RepID=A0A183KBV0_9TREM
MPKHGDKTIIILANVIRFSPALSIICIICCIIHANKRFDVGNS